MSVRYKLIPGKTGENMSFRLFLELLSNINALAELGFVDG